MVIFQAEIDLGISDLIKNNYISYASSIIQCSKTVEYNKEFLEFLAAANKNPQQQTDLLYRNAILASVGWNKNDDVFDKLEMIKAKDTPVDKQVNFMHNELDIIGHMINSIVLGQDGSEVTDLNNTPDLFDIGVGFCVYKQWESEERKALIANIIDQIDTGKWFVSMECRFPKFDYAVMDSKGNQKVIERTAKSSFLSKHLRAYGGSGEYQGHRIGRLLRDFYFTGKGIVDNPANERSVIYGEKPEKFISVGSLNVKDLDMDLEKKVAELEAQLKASEKLVESLEVAKQAVATVHETHSKELETSKSEYKTLSERLKEVENSLAIKVESITKIEDDNTKLVAKLNEAEAKVKEFSDAAHKATRISALVSNGVEVTEAEKIFAKWSTVTDEQFTEIAALYKKEEKEVAKCEDEKDMKDKKEEKKEGKPDFSKAEVDKGSEDIKLDESVQKDGKSLAAALMDVLPCAAKAQKRKEQTK